MRRFAMTLGVLAAVLFVAGVSAQNKKDFTGTWTADAEKNGAPAANARAASDFTVTMDAKAMNIETTRGNNVSKNAYKLDGSVSKNDPSQRQGGTGSTTPIESVAKWDGDKVVITTKTAAGETKTTYWLDAGGDLVRELQGATPAGGKAPDPTRTYFKKK